MLLSSASRPQGWHDWLESQGYHSYHCSRFEIFYMYIRTTQVDCGVALLRTPRTPLGLAREGVIQARKSVEFADPFAGKPRANG